MGFRVNEINTNYTQVLSDYLEQITYDQIPEDVIERAKMMALQTIGVSLAAKESPIAGHVLKFAETLNGGPGGKATSWIGGTKLSPSNAVLVNGTIADALDWEDCSWTGHPSASIIPVAWAIAQAEGKSGKAFLTAVVGGFEVYQRIAMAVQPPADWDVFKGWGLTSWQIFGATAPACKLLGLSSEQINQAFGISAACTPITCVLAHSTMSSLYHYEHGIRSKDGVSAAELAKIGIDKAMDCFDDQYSFGFHLTEEQRPEWYTKDLGSKYLIMETLMKHWPANMWLQTPLEITNDLITKNNITAEDVEEVILDPPTFGRMALSENGYDSMMLAQFSIPFALAALICDPNPSAGWYSEDNLVNPRVLALAKKVHGSDAKPHGLMESFDMFRKGTYPMKSVTIRTKDGKVYQESMDCHLGHPANMMTREQFVDRFKVQVSHVMDSEQAEEWIHIICNIEKYHNITDVADRLFV